MSTLITLFAIGYVLFVVAIVWQNLTRHAEGKDVLWSGTWFDWAITAMAFILGPYFILTASSVAIVVIWTAMMVLEGTGAILYYLQQ